ncbi:hypothetical protein N2152v2_009243 [Parachlorella kessleri]
MEDFLVVQQLLDKGFYAAVYDGHNGDSAAKYLTEHLHKVLEDSVGGNGAIASSELQGMLADTFLKADAQLLAWLREQAAAEDANSGSCATAAVLAGKTLVVANVGDSRAVLCRGGQAEVLTTQHRVHGQEDVVKSETQRVEQVGGWVDDGRVCGVLAVSRAFGDPEFKGPGLDQLLQRGVQDGLWDREFASSRQLTGDPVIVEPDLAAVTLEDEDEFLVLATDGLWDVMDSQDVVSLARTSLRKGQTAQEVADKLAQVALKRYTADNVAVVVVKLKELGAEQQGSRSSSSGASKGGLFGLFR